MHSTEFQEDQYLFEICLCEHSAQIRLLSPVFPVIQATLQLVSARIYINLLYLLGRGLLAQGTESQDAQNNKSLLMHNGQKSRRIHHT